MSYHYDGAVAVLVFNRLDCAQEVMRAIKKVTPPRLYVISDGPRKDHMGEKERVETIRDWIESYVDWDCTLIKVYADENMGCDTRSVTGYSYVMENEEDAIFLEDDSIPGGDDFWIFCKTMLDKYRYDEKIFTVAGFNHIPEYNSGDHDYFFSHFPEQCAWATWKRAWKHFDVSMQKFQYFTDLKILHKMAPPNTARHFHSTFLANRNGWSAWDSKLSYAIVKEGAYGIVPRINLCKNIGFNREDATHTSMGGAMANLPVGEFGKRIEIRESIQWDRDYDFELGNRHWPEYSAKFWRRETLLYIAKRYCPKCVYNTISAIKRKITHA